MPELVQYRVSRELISDVNRVKAPRLVEANVLGVWDLRWMCHLLGGEIKEPRPVKGTQVNLEKGDTYQRESRFPPK